MAQLMPIDDEMMEMEDVPEESGGMSMDALQGAIITELGLANTVSDDLSTAMDYYRGALPGLPGTEAENMGRSTFVSMDVADGVEATLADILPAFSGDTPAEFTPLSEADEDQAYQESRLVSYAIMGPGRGYTKLALAIKHGLLCGTALIKASWDERVEVEYDEYIGVSALQIEQGLQQNPEAELVSAEPSQTDGPEPLYDVTVKLSRRKAGLRLEPVPRDEVRINADHNSVDWDSARFVAHQRPMPQSDLISMGFDAELVEAAAEYGNAGSMGTATREGGVSYDTGDRSNRNILVTECWYRIDVDGDGIAELMHCWLIGTEGGQGTLIEAEPCKRQPFCVGVPYLDFWDPDGISLYDKLKVVQDAKSDLMRSNIDLTRRLLKGRQKIDDRFVNMSDYLASVAGGAVRVTDMNAIQDLGEPRIPPELFSTLEMLDKVRRERGGSAIDTAGQAQQVSGDTAHGIERVMSSIEKINAMVARTMAETLLLSLYQKVHAILRENWVGEMRAKVMGAWMTQLPQNWQMREEVVVNIGLTAGERNRMAQVLGGVLSFQQQAMQAGMDGILAGPNEVYSALVDMGRYSGLTAPEQYWIDPASQEAQQAAQGKQQAALAQQQAQQQAMQAQQQVLLQMENIKAQAKLQSETIKQQAEAARQQNEMLARMREDADKMRLEYNKLRVQMIELNAKYENEPVPDTVEG